MKSIATSGGALMVAIAMALMLSGGPVRADVFNMPSGLTSILFVDVGNTGNQADTTGYGAVDYQYSISSYMITAAQYTEFLNAVAATDTYSLYSINMWNQATGAKIERSGSAGSYTYSVAADYANRPVNYIHIGSAMRFANWLSNGQPTGAQDAATTENGAYTLNGATTATGLVAVIASGRNTVPAGQVYYYLPTEDEWYKAAYHKNDGNTGNYFTYATGSDTMPSAEVPPGGSNSANHSNVVNAASAYYTTEVGAYSNSASPYGTFDQNGNLSEWIPEQATADRVYRRGGSWADDPDTADRLRNLSRLSTPAASTYNVTGFRIVAIPEPSSLLLVLAGAGLLLRRRNRRRPQ